MLGLKKFLLLAAENKSQIRHVFMKPYLVLLIFGAWSGICWRWYVCGIKQQCAGSAVETPAPYSASLAPEESTYEPRDVDSSADAAPAQALAPNPASAYPAAADEKATDKVQIVNAGDATLIHFPYNSVRREDNESIDAFLNDLAAQLIAGGAKVKLTGHTDFVGTAEKNKKIGFVARAEYPRRVGQARRTGLADYLPLYGRAQADRIQRLPRRALQKSTGRNTNRSVSLFS